MAGHSTLKTAFCASTMLAGLALASMPAQAGGFAIREQSAYYQGLSFAGAAAGGSGTISSMFWNPATLTQAPLGVTIENNATGIFGDSNIRADAATIPPIYGGFIPPITSATLLALGNSGNIAERALVPSGYISWNPGGAWAFGVSMNGPFGLVTNPRRDWAGMFYSRESEVWSLNVTPQAAYKVNDWISVGVGLQVQYMRVQLDQAFPGSGSFVPLDPDTLSLFASGIDVGFTAGITLTPTPWTSIGIGYRSGINQTIEGKADRPAFVATFVPFPIIVPGGGATIRTTIPLPDTVSLGVRQKITEQFTLLGTAEWTRWSRFDTVPVQTIPVPPAPGIPTELPFQWNDGWFVSVGAEYQFSPTIGLRAGLGYERSPITDETRTTRLPDADRIWASAGLSWAYSERLTFDLGYTHIFVEDAPINIVPGHPSFNPLLGTFTGLGQTDVDIISLGIRYRFRAPPRPVVTKG